MVEKLESALATFPDNGWAFMLFILAGALSLVAHSNGDKDLMTFANSFAMTGAALFHGKEKKD